MRHQLLPLLISTALLGGCARDSYGPLGIGAVFSSRSFSAAEPLLSKEEDACLDNPAFLWAVLGADMRRPTTFRPSDGRPDERSRLNETCVALAKSLTQIAPTPPRTPQPFVLSATPSAQERLQAARIDAQIAEAEKPAIYRRNEIVDSLIAVSNRKCGRYTALLKTVDGAANSALGLGAIITGGLGAIVAGEATAKTLSGTSAIITGSRAELNKTYLTNQTIQVLAAAYENTRREERRQIANREACPLSKYTLMRGIEDALTYHASCSLVVGLQAASDAVQRSNSPDIAAIKKSMVELAALRRTTQQAFGEEAKEKDDASADGKQDKADTPDKPKPKDAETAAEKQQAKSSVTPDPIACPFS